MNQDLLSTICGTEALQLAGINILRSDNVVAVVTGFTFHLSHLAGLSGDGGDALYHVILGWSCWYILCCTMLYILYTGIIFLDV